MYPISFLSDLELGLHNITADSLEKTLVLGRIEGRRRRGQQRMRWLDGITNSMDESAQAPGDGEVQGSLVCCRSQGHKEPNTTE